MTLQDNEDIILTDECTCRSPVILPQRSANRRTGVQNSTILLLRAL